MPVIFHIDVNSAFLSWEAVYRLAHKGGKLDLRDSLEEVLRLVTGFAPVAFDKTENVITVELIK